MSQAKERPILFSGPMVRAILEGRKTVTRRPVKDGQIPRLDYPDSPEPWAAVGQHHPRYGFVVQGKTEDECAAKLGELGACPFGEPGDRLWVRETWFCDHYEVMRGPYLKPDDLDVVQARDDGTLVYAADGLEPYEADQPTWKPSIHMPRWASRILLEITAVRVERLQDITLEQAIAEGVDADMCRQYLETSPSRFECKAAAIHGFAGLWQSTGGNWDANPWVWVVEFKRIES
ncbi:hypothetical protein LOY37_14260 [Pseudomonas sp. B21-012]|uniref:hypothetical protein n=1 Tax=Pseudomonas sp. B21-012 TaxID=2895472 RepID=UPI00215DDC87|nr:hypothetical protein [Pseudomonas sp. B21-012]UVM53542.1 hypothetical protein LOY37_14260 [Pseudomonas sp. B21-012]